MTYETKSRYGNMLAAIVADFKRIPESRVLGRAKYRIATVLTLVLIAMAAGQRTWLSFSAFADEYHEFFRDMVPYFTAVPSKFAIGRLVGGLEPRLLHDILFKHGKTFAMFANAHRPGPRSADDPPRQIILDGKTIKGAVKPGEDGQKHHIVNAVSEKKVFLGSMGVDVKSNEIPVYPILMLQLFDCESLKPGDLISIDAMGCQTKVAELASRLGLKFLFSLKGNQTNLADEVQSLFQKGLALYPDGLSWHSTPRLDSLSLMPYNPHPRDLAPGGSADELLLEKGHGRLDERECAVIYLEPPRPSATSPPSRRRPPSWQSSGWPAAGSARPRSGHGSRAS